MWGTCLGYEAFAIYESEEGQSVLGDYRLDYGSLKLKFTKDPRDTKMYGWLQDKAFAFEDHNMTYNAHNYSIDPEKFKTDKGLREMFDVTAISYLPSDGRPFVASVESPKYPIFGTQYHPEKTTSTYSEDNDVNRSWLSVHLNRHFADYFTSLARKNTHKWGDYKTTQRDVVQNNDLIVTSEWYGTVYAFQ